MKVVVKKYTGLSALRWACGMTTGGRSKASLASIYSCEHSPMRTQRFYVELIDIPYSVHVHFRTHHAGIDHYVQTSRPDRGNTSGNRYPNVNHGMDLNAQALINLSRKRLCYKTEKATREVMWMLKLEVAKVDPDLAECMVPDCFYRGGVCHEHVSCGRFTHSPVMAVTHVKKNTKLKTVINWFNTIFDWR